MAVFEKRGEDQKQQWSRFWHSASGFWRRPAAWRIWLVCVSLVAIVILQLYVQFRLTLWNRNFFDALERRQSEELLRQVLLLLPLCGASITLAISSVWGRMTVQRKWREWLASHLIAYWIDEDRYARLARTEGKRQIPEYRIAEDARVATDAPIDFALGLLSSLLTAGIFIQVLWEIGGDASFVLFGNQVWIPGYLVVGVIAYSGVVTAAMLIVGSPLVKVVQIKNQAEAELITAANLLRDVGEGVIPQTTGPEVKRGVSQALQKVLAQWRRLCGQLMRNTLVSHGNSLLSPVAGLILCAPKFLAGSMTLGELTQAAAAFTLVQGSFNWVVDNYGRGADWISSLERVGGLLISLDELNRAVRADDPTTAAVPIEPATPLQ